MKRSDFISGLEQVLYDSQHCDSHDMEKVMAYIEKHMLPPTTSLSFFEGTYDNSWEEE